MTHVHTDHDDHAHGPCVEPHAHIHGSGAERQDGAGCDDGKGGGEEGRDVHASHDEDA
ncbi:hypothetical protein [Nonomuraea sp. bgisy101]|uniref:hypothetical protein n=1 Tax=Nonomuraea sp. bgisy101 TaxID=3413784 RepID=UPI003D74B6EF